MRRLQLFANQPFRWYAISCVLAAFANGLTYIASTWFALELRDSVTAVAILMLFFWLPYIICSPIGGVVADRYSRKQIMVLANGARGIFLLGFGLLLKVKSTLLVLYLINAALGLAVAAYLPAALSLVPLIVSRQELLYANATIDLCYEIGNVAGMGSAGFFISLLSMHSTFVVAAIIFLLAAFCSYMLHYERQPVVAEPMRLSFASDFIDGMKYLVGKKLLLALYFIQVLLMIDFMTAPVLLPPFARNVLHASATQFGYLEASLSVGIVLGGIITPYFVDKVGMKIIVVTELSIMTAGFIMFSFIDHLQTALILYFVIGFCLGAWPILVTQAQERTDIYYQGRLQSNFVSLAGFLTVIMFLIISYFSHYIQVSEMYWFQAVFTLVALCLAWKFCPVD